MLLEEPVLGLYEPGEQGMQADWPPFGLYVPAAHDRHALLLVEPLLMLKVPAAQGVQTTSPVVALYVPGRQGC